MAFGQPVETRYDFSKADVIVSLDADFLYAGFPGNARYIRDFASRRNPDGNMSRFYAIECTPTSTGAKADHRLPVRAVDVEGFTRALFFALTANSPGAGTTADYAKVAQTLASDLAQHHGSSLILPGDHQSPPVHALAHALNA